MVFHVIKSRVLFPKLVAPGSLITLNRVRLIRKYEKSTLWRAKKVVDKQSAREDAFMTRSDARPHAE